MIMFFVFNILGIKDANPLKRSREDSSSRSYLSQTEIALRDHTKYERDTNRLPSGLGRSANQRKPFGQTFVPVKRSPSKLRPNLHNKPPVATKTPFGEQVPADVETFSDWGRPRPAGQQDNKGPVTDQSNVPKATLVPPVGIQAVPRLGAPPSTVPDILAERNRRSQEPPMHKDLQSPVDELGPSRSYPESELRRQNFGKPPHSANETRDFRNGPRDWLNSKTEDLEPSNDSKSFWNNDRRGGFRGNSRWGDNNKGYFNDRQQHFDGRSEIRDQFSNGRDQFDNRHDQNDRRNDFQSERRRENENFPRGRDNHFRRDRDRNSWQSDRMRSNERLEDRGWLDPATEREANNSFEANSFGARSASRNADVWTGGDNHRERRGEFVPRDENRFLRMNEDVNREKFSQFEESWNSGRGNQTHSNVHRISQNSFGASPFNSFGQAAPQRSDQRNEVVADDGKEIIIGKHMSSMKDNSQSITGCLQFLNLMILQNFSPLDDFN